MTFLKFLSYNNAVPIAISIMLMGGASAFAATNPDAIYSVQEQVVSIDNTYLVNKDLSNYSPRVEIISVTEDDELYYVAYNFYTIDLQDGAWRDVAKTDTLKVSKADLGQYRDLGVYVTEQLKQRTDRELAYLEDVQNIEKKNVTHKVVATQYGGLVGKFLDTKTEELPGYTPVVTPPPPVQVASAGATQQNTTQQNQTNVASGNPTLSMQILGNSPAQIPLRSSYLDLGVVASDGKNSVIRIETYLDGVKVEQVQIDTTATSTHTVRYVALDPQNNSLSGERTVIVYDATLGQPVPQEQVKSGVTVGASISPVPAPNTTASTETSTTASSSTTITSTPTEQVASTTASVATTTSETTTAQSPSETSTSTSTAATSTSVQSSTTSTNSNIATSSPETSPATSTTSTSTGDSPVQSTSDTNSTTTAETATDTASTTSQQ